MKGIHLPSEILQTSITLDSNRVKNEEKENLILREEMKRSKWEFLHGLTISKQEIYFVLS